MKSLLIILNVFLLSAATLAANGEFILTSRALVEYSGAYEIATITEVRTSLNVYSTGSVLRPDCFKEYRNNLPFAPQTVAYTVSTNLQTYAQNQTYMLRDVYSLTSILSSELQKKLNLGCDSVASLLVLVSGTTAAGKAFHSDLQIYIENGQAYVISGLLKETLQLDTEKRIDLVPSIYTQQDWEILWQQLDPRNAEITKNY